MKPQAKATTSLSKPPSVGQREARRLIRDFIQIEGARENNLKNLSLKIPKKKFIVITGPSGSGKSSLAFDSLFAEGQRRFVESLSAYAKQFVHQMKRPEIDSIQGLCPSIAIQQKNISKNPRSTVGTVTEIYDYLRLLYSRVGEARCPHCDQPVSHQSLSQIVDQIYQLPKKSRISIMAIIAQRKKGEFAKEINDLVRAGLVRVRIDGQEASLELGQRLEKSKPHNIEVFVDRLILDRAQEARLEEAVQKASELGKGRVVVEMTEPKQERILFSQSLSCGDCGFSLPEMSPRLFSFNSPLGACSDCRGLGSLDLTEEPEPEDQEEEILHEAPSCASCEGTRLNVEARSVRISGKRISDISRMTPDDAIHFFDSLQLDGNSKVIAEKILKEIVSRLKFLSLVGLDYLQLDRLSSSLSGGEEQRVRLATQLGVQLTGVLYILDEPSIGLHQVDNDRLIQSLKGLRDAGNTVIVVEHDLDTILEADFVIDLGPGAGEHGGQLMAEGPPRLLKKGLTADFILGRERIELPETRREPKQGWLEIRGAKHHNLKSIDCKIPLGCFSVVTGVSGSGKSSLIMEVLSESLRRKKAFGCDKVLGAEKIEKVIRVTQSPIGRTPRSNPATYIGLFSLIREIFSKVPMARQRAYRATRFSFNTKGGRCESCQGAGEIKLEMHFLPGVRVECETCFGRRYNSQTLEVRYKNKNIFDVLEMSFEEAFHFFEAYPQIQKRIQVMLGVGLAYIKLGQSATTLSGGEAQRVKLAKELVKRAGGQSLYILDEPTTGLHLSDIRQLLKICQSLVDRGDSVLMIEHHLDVIKSADYIIDLGPGGGRKGGEILASGRPEEIVNQKKSMTGKYLQKYL
ncbi:MAG: excinuclease ABC subunit A [Bradymonadales bacterium]|nr:MAG: excinuclease ABC subunit A [Bradymonadales bacterium]